MIKSLLHMTFGFSLLFLAFGQPTVAQDTNMGVLEACETEREKFCKGVTPGHGHILACMYAYEDQLSDACEQAISDYADAIDYLFANTREVFAVCGPDIQAQCSDVEVGGGQILSCLSANKSEISTDCEEVVETFSDKFDMK